MNKSEIYRVCLKSGNFEDIPTFRIKIGSTQKKISPYFIPSDKQRYNCDSILDRNNQEPEMTLSVFYAYKFIGSGSIQFNKAEMPNEKIEIVDRQKQKIATIDASLIKIDKVIQVPALEIKIKNLSFTEIGPKDMSGLPFIVLKYGQLNYQTEKEPVFTTDLQYVFNELFNFPQSEMERIIIEYWCQMEGMNKFLGVSLLYLRQKDDLNKEIECTISYMSKKRGKAVISVFEDKNKAAKMKDYSNAPKRTIKTTVVDAVTLDPVSKGTFIKLIAGKQEFDTTPLFVQEKALKWNQGFTMQVNSEKEELEAKLCVKEDQDKHKVIGRAFLQISRVANRVYELTILDEKQRDIGKIYLQFFDHELVVKKKKKIPQELADKICSDGEGIKKRYNSKQPLHEYLQTLHAVLQQGMITVIRNKSQNPLQQLGEFLLSYKSN